MLKYADDLKNTFVLTADIDPQSALVTETMISFEDLKWYLCIYRIFRTIERTSI